MGVEVNNSKDILKMGTYDHLIHAVIENYTPGVKFILFQEMYPLSIEELSDALDFIETMTLEDLGERIEIISIIQNKIDDLNKRVQPRRQARWRGDDKRKRSRVFLSGSGSSEGFKPSIKRSKIWQA